MLPKINHPTFSYILPVSKKNVTIRPMTVSDEKMMLFVDGTDPLEIYRNLKILVQGCVTEPTDLSVEDLCQADFDFLALMVRAISSNNKANVMITIGDKKVETLLDLNDYKITEIPESPNIKIGKGWSLKLRYLRVRDLFAIVDSSKLHNALIESVYNSKEVLNFSEYTEQEREEFISNLSVKTSIDIAEFYNKMPRLYYELDAGGEKVRLEGILNFFP